MRTEWIRANVSPGEKIVDIGSHDGHVFDGWDRANITSVDLDVYNLPNFVRADAQSLPFKDKEFDVAVLAEILEHVPNAVKAMKEARRVAKRVVITVPNEWEWDESAKPFNPIEKQEEESGRSREDIARDANKPIEFHTEDNYAHLWHIRWYNEETLGKDLKAAGFTKFHIFNLKQDAFAWFGVLAE